MINCLVIVLIVFIQSTVYKSLYNLEWTLNNMSQNIFSLKRSHSSIFKKQKSDYNSNIFTLSSQIRSFQNNNTISYKSFGKRLFSISHDHMMSVCFAAVNTLLCGWRFEHTKHIAMHVVLYKRNISSWSKCFRITRKSVSWFISTVYTRVCDWTFEIANASPCSTNHTVHSYFIVN